MVSAHQVAPLWQLDQASPALTNRILDCQEALELELATILDKAQSVGWTQGEAMLAVEELIVAFRKAYAEDPDPAEDPIDGPTESRPTHPSAYFSNHSC